MDNAELIKIAVTAAVTVCFKEIASFVLKHSKTVAATLNKVASGFLRRHWRGFLAVFDLCTSIFGIGMIILFLWEDDVATSQGFSAFMAMCAVFTVLGLLNFREDMEIYLNALQRKSPEPTGRLDRTAAPVPDEVRCSEPPTIPAQGDAIRATLVNAAPASPSPPLHRAQAGP